MKKNLILVSCALLAIQMEIIAQRSTALFNGKNLDGWYVFLKDKLVDEDPDSTFAVKDEMIHASGKDFGYISTKNSYKNFHLSLDFKWGEKKHPPRENAKRDGGILYYFTDGVPDHVWPRSIEFQIQEGDCGDFWLVDSTSLTVKGKRYLPTKNQQVVKFADNEKPSGQWNTVEVIANNGKCTHIINGVVVNEGEDANVREGKIALQSEGAEIYYRNIRIEKL
ncbi:MAG: DUF1080 domain-containing protein [Chitinophagaceae bacterium]